MAGDYNTVVCVLLLVFCCNWRHDNAVSLCGVASILVHVTSGLDDWYSNKFRGNCIKQTIGGTRKDLTDNKVIVYMNRLRTREIHIRKYMLIFVWGP